MQGTEKREEKDDKKQSVIMVDDMSDALILSVSSPMESWILDFRALFHSCPSFEIMENYISGDFGLVYLTDDEHLKIIGKEDVWVKMPNAFA